MTEWKSVKVGDLGVIVTGKTPKTAIKENYGGTTPFLTPSDNMKVKFVSKTNKTLSEQGVLEVRKALIPQDSVCVSCIGSDLGKVVITTRPTVTNQQINSIIVDQNRFDVSFIYYAMSILGRELNFISKTSTAVPIVNKSSFSEYEILCPPLNIQHKIGKILSSLDDKIDLNNKINDNLEQQAQTLYRKYFSETGNTGELADVCNFSQDKIAVSELSIRNYFSTENMLSDKKGATEATNLPAVQQTTACHYGNVLISNIRPYFKKILYCQCEGGCSNDVLCFVPKTPELSAYLYCTLYADNFFDFMVAGSKGTKMPRGDKNQIMTYKVCMPSKSQLKDFNAAVLPMFQLIENNRRENMKLSLVRDTLLPKLMAGKICNL